MGANNVREDVESETSRGFKGHGPVLDFTDNAESAVLDRQTVEIVTPDLKLAGKAEIKLDLAPVPGLYVYSEFDDPCSGLAFSTCLSKPEAISLLDGNGQRIKGASAGSSWNASSVLKLKWRRVDEPVNVVGDGATQMTELVAHVFNLEYHLWRRSANSTGVVELEHEPWKGRLALVEEGAVNIRELRENRGSRMTHIVEVGQNGRCFNGEDADKFLQAMRYFLTFAKGGMCDLVCPSGSDDAGKKVWERWSSPRHCERPGLRWFDGREAEPLVELFPGFMERWGTDGWDDALGKAIWWYALANSGSSAIDQGIVTAQIAMERLSYEYCVRERGLVSEKGFEKLDAADRYRLLLSCLDIPLTIPSTAAAVVAVSKERNWRDSPEAVTAIRNKLVHAGRKELKLTDEGYVEAWLLATWLLELTILALCDFEGEYWNRVVRAKEPVPWAL